jgi:drug/metabolite transporter (DMT)-like permease
MLPWSILFYRYLLASAFCVLGKPSVIFHLNRSQVRAGILEGILICLTNICMLYGAVGTTTSRNSFLMSTNVILVPFLMWLFLKKIPRLRSLFGAAGMMAGLAFLNYGGTESGMLPGDWITLLSALFFAAQIVYMGQVPAHLDPLAINAVYLLTSAVLYAVGVGFTHSLPGIFSARALGLIVYLAAFPTCAAFLLQIVVQRYTTASTAGIFYSLQSLFGALFARFLLLEPLSPQTGLGGAIMLLSAVFSQRDSRKPAEIQG